MLTLCTPLHTTYQAHQRYYDYALYKSTYLLSYLLAQNINVFQEKATTNSPVTANLAEAKT